MKISLNPDEFKELLLSHHPNHPLFDNDVIHIGKYRICAGCLFGYPTAFFVLFVLKPDGPGSILIAIILALGSQVRRFTHNTGIKNLSRFVAGIALGFGIGGVLWAFNTRNFGIIVIISLSALLYASIRAYFFKKKLLQVYPAIK
jgi:hypothetical protein